MASCLPARGAETECQRWRRGSGPSVVCDKMGKRAGTAHSNYRSTLWLFLKHLQRKTKAVQLHSLGYHTIISHCKSENPSLDLTLIFKLQCKALDLLQVRFLRGIATCSGQPSPSQEAFTYSTLQPLWPLCLCSLPISQLCARVAQQEAPST